MPEVAVPFAEEKSIVKPVSTAPVKVTVNVAICVPESPSLSVTLLIASVEESSLRIVA